MVSARKGRSPLSSLGPMPLVSLGQGSNIEVDGWSEDPHR
jgi:hypothetical protein